MKFNLWLDAIEMVSVPALAVLVALLVFFDAVKVRMAGAVGWSVAALFIAPLALPLYLYFRRMHRARVMALIAAGARLEPEERAVFDHPGVRWVFGGLALATAAIVVSLTNDVLIWRGGLVVGAALIGKGLRDIARRSL